MKKTNMIAFAVVWLWVIPNARGQSIGPSTINATGGSGTIGSNKFDWSIGEMTMVSTFTSSSVIVTQGVLQNNNGTSGITQPSLNDQLKVFPNPASTEVNLQMTSDKAGVLNYKLLDMNGKLIIDQDAKISQGLSTQQINVSALAAAVYMLEVTFSDEHNETRTTSFKIEKLK